MKRPGPLLQMTFALVGLCGTLVLLADLFFGVLPDPHVQTLRLRKQLGEALAVQVAALLPRHDRSALQQTLDSVVARTPQVRSLAVRHADGTIVLQAGDHARHWRAGSASDTEHVSVALKAGGTPWGGFEIAFASDDTPVLLRWLRQPLVVLLLFIWVAGTLVFGLYMRRALQHLDPASVIPERVQGAFDTMSEGVVVLDLRGRVLLANRSFQALRAQAGAAVLGKPLSGLPWLAASLGSDVAEHPWQRALAQRAPNAGHTLRIAASPADGAAADEAQLVVVNCAPIADPGGAVRGCIVTFDDVSQLDRTNTALRATLAELEAAKQEVERQNLELGRLATRDPLTGCLNRRAFREAFDALLERARGSGGQLACFMLDIDHFKRVNDNHGHAVGDRVIQAVATKLLDSARSSDLVCRYGGEEFCVVAPGFGAGDALAFAERLRAAIERDGAAGIGEVPGLRFTVSVGFDMFDTGVASAAALLDRADQALYAAKRGGRNRVSRFAAGAGQAVAAPGGAAARADAAGVCNEPA